MCPPCAGVNEWAVGKTVILESFILNHVVGPWEMLGFLEWKGLRASLFVPFSSSLLPAQVTDVNEHKGPLCSLASWLDLVSGRN